MREKICATASSAARALLMRCGAMRVSLRALRIMLFDTPLRFMLSADSSASHVLPRHRRARQEDAHGRQVLREQHAREEAQQA